MKLKPLRDRLVLKRISREEKTATGIIMPNASKEKNDYAEVVEISEDLKDKAAYKIGDKVLFTQYAGLTLNDGDEEYIVIKDEDILAIIID